jgi:hypothetical protein
MAKLRIQSSYQAAWTVFDFQHEEAVADRDSLLTEIEERFGHKVASDIQRHVDVALGRIQADEGPNPAIMAMSEFFDLLAVELSVREVAERIEVGSVFRDADDDLLPSLGLSWRQDVLPLIDGRSSPGQMPVENVKKFLGMVQDAEGSVGQISDDVRGKRQELAAFLEKAVKLGEPIWCEL